jgi:hypothetical protein
MGYSKSLRSYDDAKAIFDRALSEGGIRVNCKHPGQAVNLRARLNNFRTLDRQSMCDVYPPSDPRHGISVYDPFVVRLVGDDLLIEPRGPADYTIVSLTKGEAS